MKIAKMLLFLSLMSEVSSFKKHHENIYHLIPMFYPSVLFLFALLLFIPLLLKLKYVFSMDNVLDEA